jgi:tetratricopeptide (TPR) repeat protein
MDKRLDLIVWSMVGVLYMATIAYADDVEKAYALNQDAMVDMSTAEFESAAQKFLEAAALVPDYRIKDRPLRYTPTFMAAWAFEKMGNLLKACVYYKKFLEIAPAEEREPTKAEHAQDFLNHQCSP